MKKFLGIFCLFFLINSKTSFAALPFVTDDASISNPNQVMIEMFSEIWHLPQKGEDKSLNLSGNYLGFSYGVNNYFEVTAGGLAAYDFSDNAASFANPILQLKTVVFRPKPDEKEIPSVAFSMGYVNKNGSGQYFDKATNLYFLGIATSRFFDERLLVHVNAGPKASYDLETGRDFNRFQLGIAVDFAPMRKDFRVIAETYNGTPNSPRDSPGFFHSYQFGVRWLKSLDLAFHLLYGSQPAFAGYDETNSMTYRRSQWVQFGIRKSIDDIF